MVHNFSAGPAILPKRVFQEASKAVIDFKNSGLSILEISHRSDLFVEVMDKTQELAKELLGLEDEFDVLFLTGGASSQFFMSAMNFLKKEAIYIDTGTWSTKALKEAGKIGKIEVIRSEDGYGSLPKNIKIRDTVDYVHITSNNTIYGTQFGEMPHCDAPIVCDMSSDIMSKPIDVSKYGMIYAGAQKNLGPAGTTLVAINKNFSRKDNPNLPTMLNYQTHIDKKSMFNTPPVFPIYVCMLNMLWIKENGGLKAMEERNNAKAELLYNEIDNNDSFVGIVKNNEDRSKMNVTFDLVDKSKSEVFLELCNEANCSGVKGHRSVGGFRASIYNAMEYYSVGVLVDVMKKFDKKYG